MNISLPPALREWVEEQLATGGFGTASEYFRHLVRRERQRLLRQQIEHNLHEALDSGESTPMTAADWKRIRREGRRRIAKRRRAP